MYTDVLHTTYMYIYIYKLSLDNHNTTLLHTYKTAFSQNTHGTKIILTPIHLYSFTVSDYIVILTIAVLQVLILISDFNSITVVANAKRRSLTIMRTGKKEEKIEINFLMNKFNRGFDFDNTVSYHKFSYGS